MKKILFFPSHDPEQYFEIARHIEKEMNDIKSIFLLLNRPKESVDFDFYSYEEIVNKTSDAFAEDEVFGSNLNELCLVDRLHKPNQDLKNILGKFRHGLREILLKENISAVMGYALSDSITYATYFACKSIGIKYYFINGCRCQDYYHLSYLMDGSVGEQVSINSFSRQEIKLMLEDKVAKRDVPSYASDPTMAYNKTFISRATSLASLIYSRTKSSNKLLDFYIPVSSAIKKYFDRKSSVKEHFRFVKPFQEFYNKKYVFYPLHLHPETATLIWGRWLHNQIEILKMIARSLPSNVFLLVKEHKVAIGRHSKGFYEEIAGIPNTFLVDMDTNPHEIIDQSQFVATISGTAGLEALCHGKKVLLFGDVCFKDLPGIIRAKDITMMKSYVNQCLNEKDVPLEENIELMEYMQKKVNCSLKLPQYNAKSLDKDLILTMSALYQSTLKHL